VISNTAGIVNRAAKYVIAYRKRQQAHEDVVSDAQRQSDKDKRRDMWLIYDAPETLQALYQHPPLYNWISYSCIQLVHTLADDGKGLPFTTTNTYIICALVVTNKNTCL